MQKRPICIPLARFGRWLSRDRLNRWLERGRQFMGRDLLPCRRLFFRAPAIGPTVFLMLGPTAFAGAIPLLSALPRFVLAPLPLLRDRLQATRLATKDLCGMVRHKRTVARLK